MIDKQQKTIKLGNFDIPIITDETGMLKDDEFLILTTEHLENYLDLIKLRARITEMFKQNCLPFQDKGK